MRPCYELQMTQTGLENQIDSQSCLGGPGQIETKRLDSGEFQREGDGQGGPNHEGLELDEDPAQGAHHVGAKLGVELVVVVELAADADNKNSSK